MEAIGPLHETCMFLRLPEDLEPMSGDFKRGLQHHNNEDPVLRFILDHPVPSLILDIADDFNLNSLEVYLEDNGFSHHHLSRLRNLIDGYFAATIFLDFRNHWDSLKDGKDALDELMDTILPRFHLLRENAAKFDDALVKLAPETSIISYEVAKRIRYWYYQQLCLLREDLQTHSCMSLDRRISVYTENLCLWQRIWWSLPSERMSNKIYFNLGNL